MRLILTFLFLLTSLIYTQISNVRQTTEKNRIIITYDLIGRLEDEYKIIVTATNEDGETIKPHAIVGDITAVKSGKGRSIWWQTTLDGFTTTG
jgi:hypothetical protein